MKHSGSGGNISITGGTVNAAGAPGIGGAGIYDRNGFYGQEYWWTLPTTISISGGEVNASVYQTEENNSAVVFTTFNMTGGIL